jgi:putative phosphoesterase
MMLIYAVADVHGDAQRIARIRAVVAENRPDALVIAGDIISYIRPVPVLEQFDKMNVPVLVVRGNSDPGYVDNYFNKFQNIRSLHLKKEIVGSIPFTGLSGTIPLPFRNKVRLLETNLAEKSRLFINVKTVFVVHTPPWGCLDKVGGRFHSGSKMVRNLVEEKQPRLLITGHIHEAAGIDAIGETTVVNCALPKSKKGMLIEMGETGVPRIEMV